MMATLSVGLGKRRSCLSTMLAACTAFGLGLLAGPASAQQYPTRTVRIITPFAPRQRASRSHPPGLGLTARGLERWFMNHAHEARPD